MTGTHTPSIGDLISFGSSRGNATSEYKLTRMFFESVHEIIELINYCKKMTEDLDINDWQHDREKYSCLLGLKDNLR